MRGAEKCKQNISLSFSRCRYKAKNKQKTKKIQYGYDIVYFCFVFLV